MIDNANIWYDLPPQVGVVYWTVYGFIMVCILQIVHGAPKLIVGFACEYA